jgi:hypothetical protein
VLCAKSDSANVEARASHCAKSSRWIEVLAAAPGLAGGAWSARALELSREHGYGAFASRAAALVETESAAGT